jgi:GntR family transcriptional regulator
MKPVDRSSALPLWAQVEADLRARIGAGEFAERFPTEMELTAEYDVSRQTLREALRRLEADGLLERQRGRGTAVRPAATLEQPLGRFYSLAQTLAAQGIEGHSRVLTSEWAPNAEAAERLGQPPATKLYHLVRVRYAGGEALAVDDSWLSEAAGRALEPAALEEASLYTVLAEAGLRASGGRERIHAALADASTRKALGMPGDVAVLVIDRVSYAGEAPFEWRRTVVRGDRFAFMADWAAAR